MGSNPSLKKRLRHRATTYFQRSNSSYILVILSILVLTPLYSTVGSAAISTWEEDGWLTNFVGEERLNRGDEFGC